MTLLTPRAMQAPVGTSLLGLFGRVVPTLGQGELFYTAAPAKHPANFGHSTRNARTLWAPTNLPLPVGSHRGYGPAGVFFEPCLRVFRDHEPNQGVDADVPGQIL